MADPMRPLLDGGASAVKDNRPGRKASGGTEACQWHAPRRAVRTVCIVRESRSPDREVAE